VGAEGYTSQMVFQMMDAFHNVFRAMNELSKPVLAVVDGVASGAGAELAAYSDLVIATDQAQFRQPEIKLGVFPPLGAVVYPRVIGPRRTMELLLTGEPISAAQALQMGLVNRVVPHEQLREATMALATKLAQQAPLAQRLAKESLRVGLNLNLPYFYGYQRHGQHLMFATKDHIEGARSFVEKRPANFKGE
jgi:enoyl-CoA hydratase/carnithine racemase